jgi:hypothetical protein
MDKSGRGFFLLLTDLLQFHGNGKGQRWARGLPYQDLMKNLG